MSRIAVLAGFVTALWLLCAGPATAAGSPLAQPRLGSSNLAYRGRSCCRRR